MLARLLLLLSVFVAAPAMAQAMGEAERNPSAPPTEEQPVDDESAPNAPTTHADDSATDHAVPASPPSSPSTRAAESEPAPEPEPELEVSEGMHPLLLLPLQAGVGSAVGLLSALVFPIAPFIVAFVVASTGDLLGQQRGPVLWPMVGGYIGMLLGALGPPSGWLLTFMVGAGLASLGLLLGSGMTMAPLVVIAAGVGVAMLYVTGASTFVVPAAAAALGAAGNGLGAAVGYYFSAENKRPGDVEFRFPGFIAPSHGPDQLIVFDGAGRPRLRRPAVASARAMAY